MKKMILLLCLFIISCATLFNRKQTEITFNGNVKDIDIYVNGNLVCSNTPCKYVAKNTSKDLRIIAKAKGYADIEELIMPKVAPITFLNIALTTFWPTGAAIDYLNDSMWRYEEDSVYINMRKNNYALNKFKNESKIKHFVLYNYKNIKLKDKEALLSLKSITGINDDKKINNIINNSTNEIDLIDKILG